MTVNVLKLHIRKVHRISCVDDFICPKCTHPVFSPPSNDDNDDANAESNENILDRNLMNQGCIPFKTPKIQNLPKANIKLSFG